MSQKSMPAVTLLIEAGMIPENALQQLVHWKILPQSCSSLYGDSPVNMESKWETVEEFVDSLGKAMTEEMLTLRETELDRSGGFQTATLLASLDGVARVEDIFVDRLGRVIFPAKEKFAEVELVSLDQGPFLEIVRREPRYEGDRQVAWVCYLENVEGSNDSCC